MSLAVSRNWKVGGGFLLALYTLLSPHVYLKYCLALTLSTFCLYTYILYPAFLSPLAKIPNVHFTSPVSSFWIKSKRSKGESGLRDVLAIHKKYGPVVQITPTELSICSVESLRQVYINGFEKTSFYNEFQNYSVPNLVSMIHNRPHSVQKRMISNVFSKSYVQNSPELMIISRTLLHDRLYPLLVQAASTTSDVDAYQLNNALGADFMNAYLFGTANGTDFIRDINSRNEIISALKDKLQETPKKVQVNKRFDDHLLSMCEAAEGVSIPPYQIKTSLSPTKPVVYAQMLLKLPKESIPEGTTARLIVASEMMDQNIAAIETAKVALTYAQWELSQRPELESRLRTECLSLSPSLKLDLTSSIPPQLPDPKYLDALPLLNAILKEILRLYAPSPGMFPRAVPPEGAVIDGYYVPGGTSVAASAYCLHRNEAVFPDAESFKPERWLVENATGVDGSVGTKTEQDRWFWAFGSGGRMCIGSHYAVYVLKLCIAAMYANFTTEIVDDTDIEPQDGFIASPKGETLVLKFHQVL